MAEEAVEVEEETAMAEDMAVDTVAALIKEINSIYIDQLLFSSPSVYYEVAISLKPVAENE